MPSRLLLSLLFLTLLAGPGFGLVEEGGSEVTLGPGAAFEVTAPAGWIFDNESCRRYFTDVVIYPLGKSWDGSDGPVISCQTYPKYGESLDKMIAREYEQLRKSGNPQLKCRDLPDLTTRNGQKARVRVFGIEEFGGNVAYIETPQFFCQISLEVPEMASEEGGVSAFEKVVESFHYLAPDSAEYQARAGVKSILVGTTQIEDILQFGPPEGWTKYGPGKPGVSIYQFIEGQNYTVIATYTSKVSSGDPEADFEAAWSELVQNTFRAGPAPPAEPVVFYTGWPMRVGQTTVNAAGQETTLVLTVFSGWGKRASLLALSNDRSLPIKLHKILESALYVQGSLTGQWGAYRSPRHMVDGNVVELGDPYGLSRSYRFSGNDYKFESHAKVDSDHAVWVDEEGTMTISGNKLTLHGQGGTQRHVRPDGTVVSSRVLPPWERTYTFKLVDIDDAYHGPHLVLEGVEENELDGVYSELFPNAFVYVLGYH